VDRFLILHEATEKAMIDTGTCTISTRTRSPCGPRKLPFAQPALSADYDRSSAMDQAGRLGQTDQGAGHLDLTPYLDEHDEELIKVMQKAMAG